MDKLRFYAPLVARILMGALFIMAGIGKLGDVAGFAGYMASGGVPAFLAWPSIIFELALGASLIVGFQARIMALLGAGFCILTAMFPERIVCVSGPLRRGRIFRQSRRFGLFGHPRPA